MNPRRRRIRRLARKDRERLARLPRPRKLKLYDADKIGVWVAGRSLDVVPFWREVI